MSQTTRIALLGCGTVGTAVAQTLLTRRDQLSERAGSSLELVGIAVRKLDKSRDPSIPAELFTQDAETLVKNCDILVEVIGGIEPAQHLIKTAMSNGACVVTANKTLVAEHGPELFQCAQDNGVTLSYEAAVAGAIPLIRPVQASLSGDSITKVMGIVNGTTNYVLDQMHTTGAGVDESISQAQSLGYAEADPTADVEGFDAASKAAILATLSFHHPVSTKHVYREGITKITATDVESAKASGKVIKLLAVCERTNQPDGAAISVRVHPTLIPVDHPLASVKGAMNAVFIEAEGAGPLMFYGAGAGGDPTASAVLGDLVSAARLRTENAAVPSGPLAHDTVTLLNFDQAMTRYHVRLDVEDRLGVLSDVAGAFANHNVSLETVHQTGAAKRNSEHGDEPTATLVVATHLARELDLANTITSLQSMPGVKRIASTLRVEGD